MERNADGTTTFRDAAKIVFGDSKNVYDEKVRVHDSLAPKSSLGYVRYDETPREVPLLRSRQAGKARSVVWKGHAAQQGGARNG